MLPSASGPLGALLMIAPLAAIPVFAIVGVPQFAPVAASPADGDEFSDLGESVSGDVSLGSAGPATTRRTADDLFAPIGSGADATETARRRRLDRPSIEMDSREGRERPQVESASDGALDLWEVRPDSRDAESAQGRDASRRAIRRDVASREPAGGDSAFPGVPDSWQDKAREMPAADGSAEVAQPDLASPEGFDAGLIDAHAGRQPARQGLPGNRSHEKLAERGIAGKPGIGSQPGEGLESQLDDFAGLAPTEESGWQAAAKRLKELGIRKYRLEAQIEDQRFLFRCVFATPGAPQVTDLFEADADTPLEAVQLVLKQIDEWIDRQSNDLRPVE